MFESNQPYIIRSASTGCSLNIVFFLKIFWLFWTLPVLLQRWCSTCLVCVHTLTPRENRERPEMGISGNLRKNTIFTENPVPSFRLSTVFLTSNALRIFSYKECNSTSRTGFKRESNSISDLFHHTLPYSISLCLNRSRYIWVSHLQHSYASPCLLFTIMIRH